MSRLFVIMLKIKDFHFFTFQISIYVLKLNTVIRISQRVKRLRNYTK